MKPTTPKNCIFMPFLDTNSHLTTKPYNFDIKCSANSESYDQHGFLGPSLGVVRILEYSGDDWLVLLTQNLQWPFRIERKCHALVWQKEVHDYAPIKTLRFSIEREKVIHIYILPHQSDNSFDIKGRKLWHTSFINLFR